MPRRKRKTQPRRAAPANATIAQIVAAQLSAQGLLVGGESISIVQNPTRSAREAFKAFHWGGKPKSQKTIRVPRYTQLYALGTLRAVEYETTKGNEHAIWVHKFGRPYPMLTATPDGRLGPILGGAARVTSAGIEH